MKCRSCGAELTARFVDLGTSPPSNSYLTTETLSAPEPQYPLDVFVCTRCWLVQLDEYKAATEIFDADYAYFSSYSRSWLEHCSAFSKKATERLGLGGESRVLEFAANDGYLLQYFAQAGIPCVGVEPTASTARIAREKGLTILEEFFGPALADQLCADYGKFDLVVGNHVIAHVPDLNGVVGSIATVLKPTGAVSLEFPHLMKLVDDCQFDTIYHEHFSYFSLTSMKYVFEQNGLDVWDVEEVAPHGGSLRVWGAPRGARPVLPSVPTLLERERAAGVASLAYYQGFQDRVDGVRRGLVDFLKGCAARGDLVVGYGAAAKGNTLLNYAGINRELLPWVVDASPHKQGKFLPGSHIPVVDKGWLAQHRPRYVLILPWNLKDEIAEDLKSCRQWGAELVVAIPRLQVF